jgi:heptosyltransferase I
MKIAPTRFNKEPLLATPRHIVVARTDKIGDLLLSLPSFQALKISFPEARVTALVSPYAKEIVQDHPAIDAVELLEPGEGPFRLAGRLKELQADTFVALYPRASQALAAWLAGIPVRVGTAFRWYSPFFNRKVKVHRSACDRHEVEYNLDLVKALGAAPTDIKIEFPLTEAERSFARDLLREKGIAPGTPYVAVHPGHKGSALNWKPEKYGEVMAHLSQKGSRVVVSAGPDETALISRATAYLHPLAVDQKPVLLIGVCTLRQLAAVYEGADCFLSGSTGTMHLAAAVGTPTVSLFCPIPETTPVRWGPWGNDSTVLMPRDLKCPDCQVGSCRKHDPMDAITVAEVLQAMEKYMGKRKK